MSRVFDDLAAVRTACPLVHNITNFVVMNPTANALLALGASPIMAHAPEEMDELVGIASALVLNIGTLSGPWIESMLLAGRAAKERNIPMVLDPVGAGASRLRTETARRIMQEVKPAIVRGNGSEILAMAAAMQAATATHGATRGVDNAYTGDAADVARALARACGCVVTVSGATDVVADADRTATITGGDALMTKVTGMGCTASALVAAFAAAQRDPLRASASAMAVMSAAGSVAAAKAHGPGTLQLHFYDALHALTRDEIETHVQVAWP